MEAEIKAARERAIVPLEARMKQFKDMLLERGVRNLCVCEERGRFRLELCVCERREREIQIRTLCVREGKERFRLELCVYERRERGKFGQSSQSSVNSKPATLCVQKQSHPPSGP